MASSYGEDASKTSLRDGYLKLCGNLPRDFSQRIDTSVRDMLALFSDYQEASLALWYLPIHEEIDTLPLIREAFEAGKRVALPYLNPDTLSLEFYEISSMDEIKRGARGLAEPPAGATCLDVEDFLGSVCFVPGLVFDGEGNRVGYGAGYYDNFLAFYPGHKIGLVRSVQVSSNPLPHDDHDIAVDVLITEGSIWRCRRI
ncbi:MAG: 5-formyltetrahydrofolate cyclo-ligase [Coriobacteriales bacterium]|nr:5-formyltetrahydrofolate cyclo-ligase [Coriobacteriales bacterium]